MGGQEAGAPGNQPGGGIGNPINTPDPLSKYKWWILGGLALLMAVAAAFLLMKTGIIGLPQVGKTSLFKILTKAKLDERGHSRQEHIGVARVPDERLDKLSALYSPKKTTYASVEYVDVAAIGQEALKETAFLASLRQVDALIHVLRAFEDDSIPHVGPIDPLRDIKNVEFDLMVSDLTQIEKRLERVEKDLKKQRTASWSANRRCCCGRKERWKRSSRCANWR
jgi:ribosome-binding ATPase YchF (GTP1/OBG family)